MAAWQGYIGQISAVRQPQWLAAKTWWHGALAVVGLVLLLGGGVAMWQRVFRPSLSPGAGPAKEVPALSLPDKPSIAVLPFDNMSRDPEQEYFSDGMIEDLITDLSKLAGLFVIARNSVLAWFQYTLALRHHTVPMSTFPQRR